MPLLYRIKAKDPDHYNDQTPQTALVVADDLESAIEKFKFGVKYGHNLTILSIAHLGEVLV